MILIKLSFNKRFYMITLPAAPKYLFFFFYRKLTIFMAFRKSMLYLLRDQWVERNSGRYINSEFTNNIFDGEEHELRAARIISNLEALNLWEALKENYGYCTTKMWVKNLIFGGDEILVNYDFRRIGQRRMMK